MIRSNRESGEGRYDIIMIPHDKSKNGVVIEIKTLDKKKRESQKKLTERIAQTLKQAKEQIEENIRSSTEANKRLFAFDNVENIIKIAIVFVGKVAYF